MEVKNEALERARKQAAAHAAERWTATPRSDDAPPSPPPPEEKPAAPAPKEELPPDKFKDGDKVTCDGKPGTISGASQQMPCYRVNYEDGTSSMECESEIQPANAVEPTTPPMDAATKAVFDELRAQNEVLRNQLAARDRAENEARAKADAEERDKALDAAGVKSDVKGLVVSSLKRGEGESWPQAVARDKKDHPSLYAAAEQPNAETKPAKERQDVPAQAGLGGAELAENKGPRGDLPKAESKKGGTDAVRAWNDNVTSYYGQTKN